jgi:gamma-glutamyltranspeptidase/glutathione hydrolase
VKRLCFTFLAIVLEFLIPLHGADRITGFEFATRSEVLAANGMAATSQPLATQVALDILKAGGTAVDAAIAANAVLGLMEPTGCGIGGDLFAIVWDAKSERLFGYNGSGRSPKGMEKAQLVERLEALGLDKIPSKGVLPLSVPGCVDGWFALHGRFGRVPMDELLAPAIRYAEEGFPVSEVIAYYWERGVAAFKEQPGFLGTFSVDGRAPREGEVWRNPGLAYSYSQLAEKGRHAFYEGALARKMADFVAEHDGFLSYEDLASHKGEWVDPVSTDYRGYRLWELPPNGQGIAALQMLNLLETFSFEEVAFGSVEHLHRLIEAKKLAFADRARFYADPAFNDIPVERLISKAYARERLQAYSPTTAALTDAPGVLETGDTIYLTVADAEGNMVSLIQSNYRGHGSGVSPEGLGFCLQNRGESFTLEAGHFNEYAPGKRPFHTIIPAFVTHEGNPYMSFGVMGGATQPQAHVQVLMNIVDFGMNLQEAGDAPRLVHTGSSQPTGQVMTDGGQVHLESGLSGAAEGLRERGHVIGTRKGLFGGYQAIARDPETGVYRGASESRKDGQAAGY